MEASNGCKGGQGARCQKRGECWVIPFELPDGLETLANQGQAVTVFARGAMEDMHCYEDARKPDAWLLEDNQWKTIRTLVCLAD